MSPNMTIPEWPVKSFPRVSGDEPLSLGLVGVPRTVFPA